MASKLSTVATFLTGMVLGAGMVYLAPPAGPGDGPGGMGGPPPGDGGLMGGPPGQVGPGGPPGADVVPPPGGGTPASGPDGQALPPPTDAMFPPPPDGAGPPDGAAGPPLPPEGAPETEGANGPTSVARTEGGATTKGGRQPDWLERHLEGGAEFWINTANQAEKSGDPALAAFAPRMKAMAGRLPKPGDRPPPLPEVVLALHAELELYDEMKAAGLDVSAIETELDELMKVR